jgi:type II secretory pathway component GspD/PulD (secretin)
VNLRTSLPAARVAVALALLVVGLTAPAQAQPEPVVPEVHVSLNFDDLSMTEAVGFVRDISGINVVVDPQAGDCAVSLRLRDILLDDALNLLADCGGLERSDHAGVVYLHPADVELIPAPVFPEDDEVAQELAARLEEQVVSLSFAETPLAEALDFVRDLSGLNLALSRGALEHLDDEVTLDVKDLTLLDALTLIGQQVGCTFQVHAGALLVREPDERVVPAPVMGPDVQGVKRTLATRRLTCNLDETPLDEAIEFLAAVSQINYALHADAGHLRDEPITLRLRDVPLADAMTLIFVQVGCDWEVQADESVLIDAVD